MARLSEFLLICLFNIYLCSSQQFLDGFVKRHQQLVQEHLPKYRDILNDAAESILHRHNHHHPDKHQQNPKHGLFPSTTPVNRQSPKPISTSEPPKLEVRNLPEIINLTPTLEQAKCPEDTLAVHYRYYNQTKKCYKLGNNAPENPCGPNMQLYPFPQGSKVYGDCDCKVYSGCDYRPLVYFNESCFHLYDQGPCQSEEWLVFGSKNIPICMERKCPTEHILFSGVCYQLETKGFCKEGQILQYSASGELICTEEPIKTPGCGLSKSVISGAPSLPCRPGQKKTGSGSCATLTSFE